MPLAQDIYNTLVKDPDLDIGESQTREEAAQTEADFRARQYVNNVRALSLATEPLEKVSPIKALLQHVSSLTKTVVSGSISIAQNILKAFAGELSDGVQDLKQKTLIDMFKPIQSSLDDKTNTFIEKYIKTQHEVNTIQNSVLEQTHMLADYFEAGYTVDNLMEGWASNDPDDQEIMQEAGFLEPAGLGPAAYKDTGFGTVFKQKLSKLKTPSGEPLFSIPHKDFKPQSSEFGKKQGVDYGGNSSMTLNSIASISTINSALNRQNSPYSVVFGGGGKLKLANKDGTGIDAENLHNPFPSGTHGRLFQSMAKLTAPTAGEQTTGHFTSGNLSEFSVADMLNAVHWISNQETPKQAQEVAEAHQVEEESINKAANFETTILPSTASTPPAEAGKAPFVMFGSWGYKKHGKHGMDAPHEVQHQAHGQGLKHGICNELGQVNKVGQALIQAAVEGGGLEKGKHYADFGTHMVLKSKGVKALCEHHNIDLLTGNMSKDVALEIAGMELMADELPDGLDWNSAMEAVFGKTPEGGVPETPEADAKLQKLVEEKADELGVSPTPEPVGNPALAARTHLQATGARLQAAHASGDAVAIEKQSQKFVDAFTEYHPHAAKFGDGNPLDIALAGLDDEYHADAIDKIMLLTTDDAVHDLATQKKDASAAAKWKTETTQLQQPTAAEKTEHLEVLKNAAAAHLESTPTSAGWDSSLKELHTAMDDAEAAGVDVLEIDTAAKDSMKEVAVEQGVQPGDLNDYIKAVMSHVNWKADEKQASPSAGIAEPLISFGVSSADDEELWLLMTEVAGKEWAHPDDKSEAVDALNNKIKDLQSAGVSPINIEYSLEKHGWAVGSQTSGDLKDMGVIFPSEENAPVDAKEAQATLEDKAKKLFSIHEHDYTGSGLSDEEIQAEKDEANQEMKDATTALASVTTPEIAEKAAIEYITDNHEEKYTETSPDNINDWLEDKEIGDAVKAVSPTKQMITNPRTGKQHEVRAGSKFNPYTGERLKPETEEEKKAAAIKQQVAQSMSEDFEDVSPEDLMAIMSGTKEEKKAARKALKEKVGGQISEEVNQTIAEELVSSEEEAPPDYSTTAIETLKNKVKELKAKTEAEAPAEEPSKESLKNDIGQKAQEYTDQKGTDTEEQALNQLHNAMKGAQEQFGLSAKDANDAVKEQITDYSGVDLLDESSEQEEAEAPVEPKGKAPEEKLDKVMTAHFGEDWEEQAKTDSDIGDVLESYGGEEGQKDLASDYKKHHIEAIKNKALDAKAGKVTAEEDAKQAEEDKLTEEANALPSEPDDLDDMAKLDEKETVTPEVATSQARELMAHQKKHGDNMSSEAKNKLAKGLLSAMKHGADLVKLKKEMIEQGDNFGSPEHLQETHEKDMKAVEFKDNHEKLISGKEGQQAREDAFHAGAHNKFTEFDEDGNPKHDINIETDKNGKAQKFDSHESQDYKNFRASQKNFHIDKGHALHDSHMLHTMSEKQQEYHDDYKKAKGEYETVNATEKALKADPDSSPEDVQKAEADVKASIKNFNEKRQTLEDSGVSMKDVDNQDDQPKSGPPDPEVARQKMAQGYVWHEETRHWILKDTLKELQGGHGGHDASIISSSHGGATGKAGAFALDEHGKASPGTNFMYHGSGNLMKVGTGKPPTGGSASNSTIAGNALHHQLSSSGHLDTHGQSATGATKIPNFTHPTKGSAGNSGIGTKAAKNVPATKLGSALDNLKEGKGLGMTSYLDSLFSKKGYPMPRGTALSLFLKEYSSHNAMKDKKQVQELLDELSNDNADKESDDNSVEKGIILYR